MVEVSQLVDSVERPLRDVAAIHAAHGAFVCAALRKLGVREADLPDMTQEVMLVVHRKLSTFDPTTRMTTWLYAICLRVASAYRRRAYRRYEVADAETGCSAEQRPAPGISPEDTVVVLDAQERLETILRSLNEERRSLFVLYEIEGLGCGEIAEQLGLPLGTVHSRLHAARKDFQAALARLESRERHDDAARGPSRAAHLLGGWIPGLAQWLPRVGAGAGAPRMAFTHLSSSLTAWVVAAGALGAISAIAYETQRIRDRAPVVGVAQSAALATAGPRENAPAGQPSIAPVDLAGARAEPSALRRSTDERRPATQDLGRNRGGEPHESASARLDARAALLAPSGTAIAPSGTAIAPSGMAEDQQTARMPARSSLEIEAALLEEARSVMPHDPARALAFTERHRADHPQGILALERDTLAVEASVRLGRLASARALAEPILLDHAAGLYADRVRRLLADGQDDSAKR